MGRRTGCVLTMRQILPIILVFTACYSAEQDNPFDPENTPEVMLLSLSPDQASQTITVT